MKRENIPVETVTEKTYSRRRFIFQLALIGIIMAFAILTFSIKHIDYTDNKTATFSFDLIITQFIQRIDLVGVRELMIFISFLGNPFLGGWSIGGLVVLALVLKKFKDSLMIFISSVGVTFLSVILKAYVGRPRPSPDIITQIGKYASSDSFPSGHVLFSMGLYGFLIFLAVAYIKNKVLEGAIVTILILLIFLMGISRIYLGAHWFSDTLGSYLIGSVWLFVMVWIYKRLVKPKAPAPS